MKTNIQKNNEVVIIAGNQRNSRGKVLQVIPATRKILVEGINIRKHFEKKTKENETGSIIEREVPIDISNVMLASDFDSSLSKRESAKNI